MLEVARVLGGESCRVILTVSFEHGPGPRDDQSYATNLGLALVATSRRAESAEAYRQALALQPHLPVAEVSLAQVSKPDTAVASLPPLPN